MAHFEHHHGVTDNYITLEADDGEELSTELVQAYALLRASQALEAIEASIVHLSDEVSSGLRRRR